MHVDMYSNSDFFCVATEIYFSKDDFLLGIYNGQENISLPYHTMDRYVETLSCHHVFQPVNFSIVGSP